MSIKKPMSVLKLSALLLGAPAIALVLYVIVVSFNVKNIENLQAQCIIQDVDQDLCFTEKLIEEEPMLYVFTLLLMLGVPIAELCFIIKFFMSR